MKTLGTKHEQESALTEMDRFGCSADTESLQPLCTPRLGRPGEIAVYRPKKKPCPKDTASFREGEPGKFPMHA